MPIELYTLGETKALDPNTFTRIGYTFAGWNTAPDGSGTSYTNEQAINVSSLGNAITLYAMWQKAPITVTFNSNGGTFEGNQTINVVGYTGTQQTVTRISKSDNVSQDGLSYSGEYGNDINRVDKITIPGAKILNVSIDMQFQQNTSYDWICVYDGKTVPTSGNYAKSIGGSKIGSTGRTHKDLKVIGDTAQIFFQTNNASNNQYGYYAVITGEGIILTEETGTYSEPTKGNLILAGWSLDAEGTQMVDLTDINANTTLYAQYKDAPTILHTANIDNAGNKLSAYGNNLEETYTATYTGAQSLNVTLVYQTQSTSYDWVCVYDGNVTPSASNYSSSITNKLGGTTKTRNTYTVTGDTLQIYFKSNASSNDYYGFYAEVTPNY